MKKIIFVCEENAGRSQMAEAFFNTEVRKNNLPWRAESAGTVPSSQVNPYIEELMKEVGVRVGTHPKQFNISKVKEFEKIISFGCFIKDAFEQETGKILDEWIIDDPQGKKMEKVRSIRDEVRGKVQALIEEIKEIRATK
jgi:arsenate reductase (thioredoxin)